MGSLMRFDGSRRPCESDCPIKAAFATTPLALQALTVSNAREAASEAEMRRVSDKIYSPIKPWQTRILHLQPGLAGAPIKCRLEVAELVCFEGIGLEGEQTLVEYEALFYSWGRPAFTSSIVCNDLPFPVTPNFADALSHIRSATKERFLWADAICINQLDLAEKARQVEIMYDIFHKASRVIAWLGMPSRDHLPLLSLLAACPSDSSPWAALENRQHGNDCKLHELCDVADAHLTETGWYGRQWIRQEVHAARDLMMLCGPYRFHFNSVASVSESLTRIRGTLMPGSVGTHNTFSAFQILKADYLTPASPLESYNSESQVWTDLLLQSAFFDSTLPQDKIYAVLGMIRATIASDLNVNRGFKPHTSVNRALKVDYTKRLPMVYVEIIDTLLGLSSNLQILLSFRACDLGLVIDELLYGSPPSTVSHQASFEQALTVLDDGRMCVFGPRSRDNGHKFSLIGNHLRWKSENPPMNVLLAFHYPKQFHDPRTASVMLCAF